MKSTIGGEEEHAGRLLRGGFSFALLFFSTFLTSQAHAAIKKTDVNFETLATLVKAQAQQIKELQARLSALEGKKGYKSGAKTVSVAAVSRSVPPQTYAPPNGDLRQRQVHTGSTPSNAPPAPVRLASASSQAEAADFATIPLSDTPPGSSGASNGSSSRPPETAASPGSWGAVSSIPLNSSPALGVDSSIPYAGRTTHMGGLVLKWGKGLPEFMTPDKQYAFRIRGRILTDYGAAFGSRFHDQNVSRTSLRAVRLGVEGRARQLSWVFEGDYSNNEVSVVSAYATWSDRMARHMVEYTLGNKFNDRGFDGSTGSAETVFLDRDLVATAILPVKGWYGLGGTFKIYGDGWHVSTQITGNDVNASNISNNLRDDLTYAFRSHWIPWRSKDALIHLGAWGFYEDVKPGATFSQKIRMLARTNDAFAARINTLPIANSLAGGLEAFGIWKTAWVLGEYGVRDIAFRRTYGTTDFGAHRGTVQAASLQTGVFLTGETPNYYALTGQWASPRVLDPVTRGGPGAWELAVRGDWLDGWKMQGGTRGWSATAGVNWYLLDYMRLMLNYTHAHVDNQKGPYIGPTGGNIVGMRAGITF